MIGDEHDPFPGVDHIGLEVAPSGPYAVLEHPWSVEHLTVTPEFHLGAAVLATHSTFVGWRLTAQVRRMTGRWPSILSHGQTHLRGFDRGGQMLWSGTVDRINPFEMVVSEGPLRITVDLLAPMTFRGQR